MRRSTSSRNYGICWVEITTVTSHFKLQHNLLKQNSINIHRQLRIMQIRKYKMFWMLFFLSLFASPLLSRYTNHCSDSKHSLLPSLSQVQKSTGEMKRENFLTHCWTKVILFLSLCYVNLVGRGGEDEDSWASSKFLQILCSKFGLRFFSLCRFCGTTHSAISVKLNDRY